MKKLFFTALIAVSMMSSAFAAPVKEVSRAISSSFATTFPSATNVQWKTTADFTKVSFDLNGVKNEAFFNPNGELIGTSHTISIDAMPTPVKRTFAKKYAGYTVKESIQFDNGEETAFYISAENDKTSVILKADRGTIEVIKVTNL